MCFLFTYLWKRPRQIFCYLCEQPETLVVPGALVLSKHCAEVHQVANTPENFPPFFSETHLDPANLSRENNRFPQIPQDLG